MRLKAFEFEQILYENNCSKERNTEIKERLKPYVLYFKKNDSIGICFKENKKDIMKILKEYGKTDADGHFIDVDEFLKDYDWDYIDMGEIELYGEDCYERFGKILKVNEGWLIDSGDKFEDNWYGLQMIALRQVLDSKIEEMKNQLEETIKVANKYYDKHLGIHDLKPISELL